MIIGGALAAIGAGARSRCISLVRAGRASSALFGFGFYLLHGCIQVHVTELSPTARGAAASLHSCFFYLGQAAGPGGLRLRLRPWRRSSRRMLVGARWW